MRTPLFLLLTLLLLTASALSQPANPNKKTAMKPNLDIYVYRRCYTPTEAIQISASGFNTPAVQLAAYRIDLDAVVKTSKTLENFGKTITRLDLGQPVAQWRFAFGKTYPDQWAQGAVKVPRLPLGVYVIQARAGGVEKRTWLAVTRVALITKRSRQELLVYAADADTGNPLPGLSFSLADERGACGKARTGTDGLMRLPTAGAQGNLWVYGVSASGPAFALAGEPSAPDPFTIYTVTDRPIYRPGALVQYKATLRQRVEADGPGGFVYRTYADRPAAVEIRDATDALVSSRTVMTNSHGSLSGTFSLASEPTLGDWHLNVSIGDYCAYGGFTVQDYRKPEMIVGVQIAKTHYLGGTTVPVTVDAQYYFGRPVVNASVQYSVSYSGDSAETDYDGKGVTDAQGQLHLQIPSQRLPNDRTLAIHAVVTDLSRRSQAADGSTTLTAGLFQFSLSTDQGTYKLGQRIAAMVQATDYDGHAVVAAKVQIAMVENKEDRLHRAYQETTTRDVVTDAAGKGVAYFSSPRPGDLSFSATAFDSSNDKIVASTDATVAAQVDATPQNLPTLSLASARPQYRPGDVATIILDTTLVRRPAVAATKTTPAQPAHPDAWALVTVEGERLGRSQVVHLTRRHAVLHIPLTAADFPSVSVNVAVIEDRQIYEQQQRLTVARQDQVLTVSVSSDKATYRPGDTATYTVTTRDFRGRPVPAEVSLGVVDSSIYAIQPDNAPDMASLFYGDQEVRVKTDFSFAAQYSGGGYQNVAAASTGNPGMGGIRVRKNFADTAYWNPVVETGADGTATSRYTVPDNLTTWRATAHAVTDATAVGSATHDAVAVMPLLVRLELPRFAVQGDQVVVSATVQNGTGTARTVQAHITAQGATLTGAAGRTLSLPAGGQARLDWPATMDGPARASFQVTADGGAGGQDAAAQTLPVLPDGLKVVTAKADTLTDADAQDSLALADLPPGAAVTLTLSPSLASAVFDALDSLAAAPGGNSEETISAFLPDIAASRALSRLHVSRPVQPHLDRWVNLGLQKLYRYQHPDGGWNWWEFDQTDGDMTAYVLGGLVQARDAGYTVDDQRILRGAAALEKLLPQEQDLGRRADWLLTLASADPPAAEKPLVALSAQRATLDLYGQASLALALAQIGGTRPAALARTVAEGLAAEAVPQGRAVSWPAPPGGCLWRDDDVTVTAHALRALLAVTPDSPLIPGAVRWLMASRDGASWDSTRAGAEAVLALSAYLEQTQELSPNYSAQVLLDGRSVGTLTATPPNVFGASTTVTLGPGQLQGHTNLTVDKHGVGVLYVSRVVTSLLPPGQVTPQARGLTVHRQFRISVDDPSQAQSIASGSAMDLLLDITADADARYVTVEDPIPAGCEVDTDPSDDGSFPVDSSDGDVGYTRQEVRDNEVVFFFDTLPKGHTRLTYHLSAETPGTYHVLPDVTALTYFPEVRGNSGLVKTIIGDQP